MIKLRVLGWGNYTGLSNSTQYNNKGPYKSESIAGEFIREEYVIGQSCIMKDSTGHERL